MTYRAGQLLLLLPLVSLAFVLFPLAPPAGAQNAGQTRSDGPEDRPRRDRDEGGGGQRGGIFGGDREGGGRRGGRGFGFGRRGGRVNEGGGQADTNRRGGEDGDRPGRPNRPQNSSASTRPIGGDGAATSLSMEDWVRGLIRQHDKNGDNMLQADEQENLGGKAKTADLNKDSVIDADELVSVFSGNAAAAASADAEVRDDGETDAEGEERRQRWGGGSRGRDRDRDNRGDGRGDNGAAGSTGAPAIRRVYTGSAGGNKSKEAADKRRTYRFTPAADRLPTDLPSSFKSRDRNGDGQIAMSEFSRTWSKRTVGDFRRHDLNGDGIITPQEALKSNWR